jgi:hypothetical protein
LKAFAPNPLASVQAAFEVPEFYYSANPGDRRKKKIPSVDAALLYKLYMESGKMINLYDMFMAFQEMLKKEWQRRHISSLEAQ